MDSQRTARSAIETRRISLKECKAFAEQGELYAILDACDAPAVPKKFLELGSEKAASLYQGTAQQELWEIAPYLMYLDVPTLDWIISTLVEEPWGILVQSKSDLGSLRRHFRHFLFVAAPTGEQWYFRFYDPRVLRVFLPTCRAEQLILLDSPVSSLGILEGAGTAMLWRRHTSSEKSSCVSVAGGSCSLLNIRQDQLDAFSPLSEDAFVEETIAYLKEQRPEIIEGLPENVLTQRVRIGFARARSYGLKLEWTLTAFIATMFSVAPNFDEQVNIHRALIDKRVAPDDRMDLMLEVTSEQDWDEAEQAFDPKAWESATPTQDHGKR